MPLFLRLANNYHPSAHTGRGLEKRLAQKDRFLPAPHPNTPPPPPYLQLLLYPNLCM